MRFADLLLCCCIPLLATGCSEQEAAAPPVSVTTAAPDVALEPKIVVQLGHQSPVLAVRWVDAGRHLASLAGDGSIVFWNVASGTILDHAAAITVRQSCRNSVGTCEGRQDVIGHC